MQFDYTLMRDWPPLAWLAACRRGALVPQVFHGRNVEATDDWFGEVAWPGDHAAGAFDRTDLVAGSGGGSARARWSSFRRAPRWTGFMP